MKHVFAILAAFSLAACSGNVSVRSGNFDTITSVPPGTSAHSGSFGLQSEAGSGSGAMLGAVMVGIMAADAASYYRGTGRWMRDPPPPDEGRRINVQDCTRPIDYSLGNLKCR
jgi:hypothetical protein